MMIERFKTYVGGIMGKEYWTVTEVLELLHMDKKFLDELEEEEIICPVCKDQPPAKFFSSADLEKLRLAKILIDEMEVNLPGVDIILRMRQSMFEMRRQFDSILEDLAHHLQEMSGKGS
jgi:MerR family transcriptional regulator/heat shock protein HspR